MCMKFYKKICKKKTNYAKIIKIKKKIRINI